MIKKVFNVFIMLAFMITTTGWATVFGGCKNKLVVENGFPPEAVIYLDGQKLGTAPMNQKIDKYLLQHGSIIELKAEGYVTDSIVVERTVHPLYTIADVLSGGIWVLVDVATGNLYRPNFGKIEYELEKESPTEKTDRDEK
jgi:hypothetical protein